MDNNIGKKKINKKLKRKERINMIIVGVVIVFYILNILRNEKDDFIILLFIKIINLINKVKINKKKKIVIDFLKNVGVDIFGVNVFVIVDVVFIIL